MNVGAWLIKHKWLVISSLGSAGLALAQRSAPAVIGLSTGGWWELVVRSTLSQQAFDPSVVLEQLQSLLGGQAFDVRTVAPDANGDPYVYDVVGIYRGKTGYLYDRSGAIVLGAASASPVPAAGPSDPKYIDARPVPLTPGTTYYGRGSVPWPVSIVISHSMVQSKLTAQGFTNVQVYWGSSALPATWPTSERGGDVFAVATWPSTSAASSIALPAQILSVWT